MKIRLKTQREQRKERGLLSISEVARLIGVSRWRIEYALQLKQIKEPYVQFANSKRAYYQRSDIQAIKQYFEKMEADHGVKRGRPRNRRSYEA